MRLKRHDLRELSKVRLREAETLLAAGHWDGAYYLAGYAVECALKACIAKSTERYEFPERDRVKSSYTHNLQKLVIVAELDEFLSHAEARHPLLKENWGIVRQWSEEARYQRRTQVDAETLIRAIRDRKNGVLAWLSRHW